MNNNKLTMLRKLFNFNNPICRLYNYLIYKLLKEYVRKTGKLRK